ncbi:tyrosine-type recombinase/integrase [Niallia sp. MER 6]|uniref:tyrosine-type recombinase/integrase n=1 Tax=Niallia sp. MER 6 TaxID=2939567 RepID=UPI00203DAF85|nr:tyrosine-type recombinase/integrase [Niallia sp. MER 6]MCM3034273.1 tyrosine-type recombinase/integrase [Niallia sp. MER 6]
MQRSNVISQFADWLETEGKSVNTVTTYQREMKKFQDWLYKYPTYLENISQKDVQNYLSFLEKQGKSPITIDKILGSIRTFAKFLKRPEITLDIKVTPIEKKGELEILTPYEYNQLLQEVKKDGHERNIAIVYLLLHTGIRVSELCSLNKSNIDINKRQLIIRNGLTGEERCIPLSEEAKTYLLKYCDSFYSDDALFTSKSNERLTERSIQYMLKKYNVHPHKLRHTFCQKLIDKGIGLEIVSKLAGHKDINVTKRYAKSRMKQLELEEAIEKTFINDTLG